MRRMILLAAAVQVVVILVLFELDEPQAVWLICDLLEMCK